jgi:hypothetical protein
MIATITRPRVISNHPSRGDDHGILDPKRGPMAHVVYELAFKGAASEAVCALFDDYEVVVGHGVTVVRGVFPDQAALHGAIERINDLGLELLDVRLVAEPAANDLAGFDPV